jgi:hypothetical protein
MSQIECKKKKNKEKVWYVVDVICVGEKKIALQQIIMDGRARRSRKKYKNKHW